MIEGIQHARNIGNYHRIFSIPGLFSILLKKKTNNKLLSNEN